MTDVQTEWPHDCHSGIEEAIAEFKQMLPGWWYSLGECQVSCDASCAPTSLSPDIHRIPTDERFNSGFHADLRQPSTLAEALRTVMHEALVARMEPGRSWLQAFLPIVMDGEKEASEGSGPASRFVKEVSQRHGIEIGEWQVVSESVSHNVEKDWEREAHVVISMPQEIAEKLLSNDDVVLGYALAQAPFDSREIPE